MSPHAQPHRLVRTLLLVVSTLAVVGVVFAIYIQYARSPEEQYAAAPPIVKPPVAPAPGATSRPSDATPMQIDGVPLPKGERTRINLYGPEGVQARLELEVSSWEPVGDSGREFRLEEPTIRYRTPGGQLVNVTADRGQVEMTRQRGENYDLARGRFEGHVVILMDRLDESQRAQLPPEQRDELTDERKIYVELDDLNFDMEYARVESLGRLYVSTAEADFEGRHLLLRYDEAASRIEYLKIFEGKRIALRAPGGSFTVTLPGAAGSATAGVEEEPEPPPERETPPASEVAAAEPADAAPVEDDGVPLFVPDAPKKPRIRETVTYTAVFEGDVVVDQFEGQTQTGLLSADRLSFLFDFGQEQRDLARQTPTSQPVSPAEPDAGLTREPAYGGESEVVLRWTGPLVVDLVRDQGEVPEEVFGKRLHVTATGREVHVADRQGSARCRRLSYHHETEQVLLHGDADSAFALDLESGGHLSGRALSFDPRGRTVRIQGPGVLSDERGAGLLRVPAWGGRDPSGEASVVFEKEMNICLGTHTHESIDPVTGELAARQRDYVQSAELVGNVIMDRNGDSIAADLVEIGFRPPSDSGSLMGNIESFHADGRVRMKQGDERITCRGIDVAMTRDANGRLVPVRAVAAGDVVAVQRQRAITATDRMIVHLHSVPVEKPPFDLVQAKVAAVRRGLNVDEIDWDAQEEEYEGRKRFALGLRRIQALGDVSANDPEQNLHIDAGQLDCTFRDGRRIDKGVVLGRGALPATIEFGDSGIMGREIEFDAGAEWAEVPGAGRMTFNSRKDLDGRALAEPIPVSVTWTDFMTFRGHRNMAVVSGSVHAASRNSTFDCRELVLDFEEVRSPASAGPTTPDPWDWWIIRPFRSRAGRTERLRLEAPKIERQLAYLSANSDVIGLTAAYDDDTGSLKTRARIAGPHLAVDLRNRTQAMTIDDAGTLLIEDYRLSAPDESGRATKMSPFGAQGDNLPSQTFVSWEGATSFYSGSRLAVFEKDVELVYRSGSKLVLAEGVLSDAALARLHESAEGRDARLMCQRLTVQFLKDTDGGASASGGGLGGVSGNEVASFAASGGVYFEDSGVSVTCRTITFDRERNLLQILGTRRYPAELIDQRRGRYRSIRGPTIYWERDTDRIEAPRSTIRFQ